MGNASGVEYCKQRIKQLSQEIQVLQDLMSAKGYASKTDRVLKDLHYEEYHLKLSMIQNIGKQRDYYNGK